MDRLQSINRNPIMTLMTIILKVENHHIRKVRNFLINLYSLKSLKILIYFSSSLDEELDYVEGAGHAKPVGFGSQNDDSTDSYHRQNNNNFMHNNKNRESNYYDNNKYSEMHKQKHR
jgi:hypothetical protein